MVCESKLNYFGLNYDKVITRLRGSLTQGAQVDGDLQYYL